MKGGGKREERRMTGEKRNDNYQKISRCYAKERWKKKNSERFRQIGGVPVRVQQRGSDVTKTS